MYDREWSVFMMGSGHILYDGEWSCNREWSVRMTGSGQCV